MKKTLIEQLKKMHSLAYDRRVISENKVINKVIKKVGILQEDEPTKKIDDPKKADLVSSDVKAFFENLKSAADGGGLEQRDYGNMEYQKEVESMQIGLMILGYDLPKHGIDGLFGPETADAVNRFINENGIKEEGEPKKEELSEGMTQLKLMSYPNLKHDFTNGTENDFVNQGLLDDINKAAEAAGIVATITTAKSGHDTYVKSGKSVSRHMNGTGVDIAILDGVGSGGATSSTDGNRKFKELGDKLASALESMGYTRNVESGNDKAVLWQTNTGGNHYNHLHVSNRVGASELPPSVDNIEKVKATPKMLNIMIDMLELKNITSEELKKYIDMAEMRKSSGSVTISLSGNWVEITKNILRKHEGFSDVAKWDENAYRGGYGTDKKMVNGQLVDATKMTTWTRQEAEEVLDYEIKNSYGPTVAKQLGVENWEKLNDKQKAALVSLGYNAGPYFLTARDYGKKIKSAIENGDMETAAEYIEKGPVTGSSSGKVYSGLVARRKEEANIFLS